MNRLRQYMEEHELTQAALADRLGVSQPTVHAWLSGSKLPSAETLKELSRKTGLTIDELLDHKLPPRASRAAAPL